MLHNGESQVVRARGGGSQVDSESASAIAKTATRRPTADGCAKLGDNDAHPTVQVLEIYRYTVDVPYFATLTANALAHVVPLRHTQTPLSQMDAFNDSHVAFDLRVGDGVFKTKLHLHNSLNPLVLSGLIRKYALLSILKTSKLTAETHEGAPSFYVVTALKVINHLNEPYVDVDGCLREHGEAAPEGMHHRLATPLIIRTSNPLLSSRGCSSDPFIDTLLNPPHKSWLAVTRASLIADATTTWTPDADIAPSVTLRDDKDTFQFTHIPLARLCVTWDIQGGGAVHGPVTIGRVLSCSQLASFANTSDGGQKFPYLFSFTIWDPSLGSLAPSSSSPTAPFIHCAAGGTPPSVTVTCWNALACRVHALIRPGDVVCVGGNYRAKKRAPSAVLQGAGADAAVSGKSTQPRWELSLNDYNPRAWIRIVRDPSTLPLPIPFLPTYSPPPSSLTLASSLPPHMSLSLHLRPAWVSPPERILSPEGRIDETVWVAGPSTSHAGDEAWIRLRVSARAQPGFVRSADVAAREGKTVKAGNVLVNIPHVRARWAGEQVAMDVGWVVAGPGSVTEWVDPEGELRAGGVEGVERSLVGSYIDPSLPFPNYSSFRTSLAQAATQDPLGEDGDPGADSIVGVGMLTSILPGLVLHERRRVVVQATLARVDLSGLAERICEGVDRLRSSRRDGEASGSRTEHDQPIVRDRFSVSPARSATAPLSPSTPQRPSTTDVITVPLSDFTDVPGQRFSPLQSSPARSTSPSPPVRRDPSSRGGPSTNHGTRSGGGDRSGRASGSGMDADEDEFVDAIEGVSSGSSSRPRPVPATQAGEENAVVMCKYVPRVMSYHVFPRPADARELSTEQAPVVFTLVSIAQPHIRLQALVGANMKYFETKNGTPLALAGDITILWSLLVVLRGVMEPHEWRRCLVMVQKMRTYVETDASRSSVPAHSVMTDLVGTVTGKVMETVERVASSKVMCVVDFVRDDAEPDQFGTEYRLGNDAQVLGRMSGSDRVRCMVSQIYRVEVLD